MPFFHYHPFSIVKSQHFTKQWLSRICLALLLLVGLRLTAAAQSTISTVAGDGTTSGTGTSTGFTLGVAVDPSGNIYVAGGNAHVVRRITPSGVYSTIAGTGTAGYSGDGGPATSATLNAPADVFVINNALYIADVINRRIRKVDLSTGIITTVAGDGTTSTVGSGIGFTQGVAADASGNIYVATGNGNVIRKITPGGTYSNFVGIGTAGYSGDGGLATSAQVNSPVDIFFSSNALYIADLGNRYIRKVDLSSNIITTVAGNGTTGTTGTGIGFPNGVSVDGAGNILVATGNGNVIRKITPGGVHSTVAGNGTNGFSGDGGPATSAQVGSPIDMNALGNDIYIADRDNYRIRKVTNVVVTPPTVTTNAVSSITSTGAVLGGNITANGNGTLTERGVVYVVGTGTPTVSNTKALVSTSGVTTGAFSGTVSGLTPGTQYTVRAYAINEAGTGYGAAQTFTTAAAAPIVTTGTAGSSTFTTAAISNNMLTSDGGASLTDYGVVYVAGTGTPTTSSSKAQAGTSSPGSFPASFTVNLSGLTAGTQYTARAYATNSVSTSYGANVPFTTTAAPALTATVSTTSGSPTSASTIPFSVSFSQSVGTTFVATDVTVANGAVTGGSFSGGSSGPYTFTVTPNGAGTVTVSVAAGVANDANNTQNSASNSVSVQYQAPTITVAPPSLPSGTVGVAYSQTFSASGGTSPYTFTLTGGSLPTGLTLASNGTLAGTPTAGGSFTFTVRATDSSTGSGPYSATRSYTLTIGSPLITVAPATLPDGTVNVAYRQPLSAAGGTAPYSFALTVGSLPPGLTLSATGVVAGTPTTRGSFTFTVTATDASTGSGPYNGARTYTVAIAAQPVTAAPVLTAPASTSATNNATPTFRGTAPAGSTVTVYLSASGGPAQALGTTTAADGSFNFTPPTALADGTYQAYATAQSPGQAGSANSNTTTFTVDTTAPTVTLSSSTVANGGTTSTSPLSFTATFSEPVTGLASAGLQVSGGAVTSGPTAGPGNAYAFQVTPSGAGPVAVRVLAGAARDQASNGNAASAPFSFTYRLACQAPTDVAVSQVNFTSATVSFTTSPSASGGYLVSYAPSGGPLRSVTTPASPVQLTGLTPNATYNVVVTSQCDGGQTAASTPPVRFTTPLRRVPENPAGTTAGLTYQYYEASGANFTSLPTFASLTPKMSGTTTGFDEQSLRQRSYGYALRFTGYVTVPQDGDYTFFTNSDDGSQLFLGDQLVVDNDGNHGGRELSGTIGLQAGTHALTVTYYQDGGDDQLSVSYQGPGVAKQLIPGTSLRVVLPMALRSAENPSGTTAGLLYQYYEAAPNTSYTQLPTFASSTPKQTGATATIDERSLRQRNYGYALRFTGYVTVPTDGIYSFYTNSDDGSQLFIGSQLVVDNDGDHGVQERTGSIGLQAGTHAFTVTYYQDGGDDQLTVSYEGPGVSKQVLPAASFSYQSASPLRAPENPSGTVAGLRYQYYESATTYSQLPTFANNTPKQTGTTTTFDERSLAQRSYGYALQYTGYVTVPADGQYTFFTNSDDGSQLFIGSTLVVDNDGNHDVRERSGTIGLQAGTHALTVTYYQDGGGDQLSVSYQGPGAAKQAIPAASLRYVPASAHPSATSRLLATTDRVSSAALAVQAYPNPFPSDVTLTFVLPQAGAYTLAIYDVMGRLIEQLPGGTAAAGEVQQRTWAAAHYASGLYLLRLHSAAGTQQLRLTKQ